MFGLFGGNNLQNGSEECRLRMRSTAIVASYQLVDMFVILLSYLSMLCMHVCMYVCLYVHKYVNLIYLSISVFTVLNLYINVCMYFIYVNMYVFQDMILFTDCSCLFFFSCGESVQTNSIYFIIIIIYTCIIPNLVDCLLLTVKQKQDLKVHSLHYVMCLSCTYYLSRVGLPGTSKFGKQTRIPSLKTKKNER